MPQPRMRNISTTHQEKYQTEDGNVIVTNFKRGVWQVMPRGHAPFTVGSKDEAFKQAIGIASRRWGRPKEEAFPRRGPHGPARRQHATKKTAAQLDREIAEALAPGASRAARARRGHAAIRSAAETKAEQLDVDIAPTLGRSRAQIVRAINAIVRAADGRNVYLVRERLGRGEVRRVTRARTKGRGMEVYLLDTGRWIGVMPELGDRIEVR